MRPMLTAHNERYQLLLSVLDAEPEVEITYFVPDERKSGGAYRTVSVWSKRRMNSCGG